MISDHDTYEKLIIRLLAACDRFDLVKAWEIIDRWYVWAALKKL